LRDFRHGSAAEPARSFAARQKVKAQIAGKTNRPGGMAVSPATPRRACAAVGAGRLVPLPDMSHFAAEFYQCCADLPARF
jgi:hypothetical protein